MKASLDVVFATYNGLPQGDPDDRLALSLLEAKGLKAAVIDWRSVAPHELDSRLVVLRTTWDYHHYYRQFLDWVDGVASRTMLRNTPDLIHWNANKKYLLELGQCDLSIVPTLYIEESRAKETDPSAVAALLAASELEGADHIVVKPAVGLSTYGVRRFARTDDAMADICAHVASLAAAGDVLIQPFLTAVEKYGERALVFLDNQFSHAVRKAAFQKHAVSGQAGETSVVAEEDEIAFGQNILHKLKHVRGFEPLYARVDVVRDDSGQMMLMELELIEPSLFLAMDPQAPSRFATAIAAVLD
jgi:hypothetical protein